MIGLTQRQSECLNFIRSEVKEKGVPPTLNEIAHIMGWKSKTVAHNALASLEARGYLKVKKGFMRAITLTPVQYDHGPDCLCEGCPARRIQYQQFIQGLQSDPEFPAGVVLVGLVRLSQAARDALLGTLSIQKAASVKRAALPSRGGS